MKKKRGREGLFNSAGGAKKGTQNLVSKFGPAQPLFWRIAIFGKIARFRAL
jgi:hypothetical protein